MTLAGERARFAAVAVLLAAVLLVGQAAADGIVPPAAHGDTGQVVGRSGFAFLTGVRQYAAAVLWSRLEPINDDYYARLSLGQKKFLLPTIRLVTLLDPTMEEPYYVGPYVLRDGGLLPEANALAEEGVRKNPQSARLHASYAQLLMVEKRMTDARVQADAALRGRWYDPIDEFDSLATLEIVFDKTGAKDKADWVRGERVRIAPLVRAEQQRSGSD